MSPATIFLIDIFTVLLLAVFVYVSLHEIRVSPPGTSSPNEPYTMCEFR